MESMLFWGLNLTLSLALAPLFPGIVNRVKAKIAGRKGQPLLQLYCDIAKLLKKGTVYSTGATIVIRMAPVISLAAVAAAALLLPYAGMPVPPLHGFEGDLILFIYLLATARFTTIVAALDTGSSFEGMGASREAQFSALAEPAFIAGLAALAVLTRELSLSAMLTSPVLHGGIHGMSVLTAVLALFTVMLLEGCRVPFDDPETHLELTMIHEAMILDYAGADLGIILYTGALKMWLFATIIVSALLPFGGTVWGNMLWFYPAVLLVAALVGLVESVTARFRLIKIPQMLAGAFALAILSIVLYFVTGGGVR